MYYMTGFGKTLHMGVWIRWTGIVEWNSHAHKIGLVKYSIDGEPVKYGLDCQLHAGHYFHRSLDQGYWQMSQTL